jgi:hypothetical protein
MLTKTAGRISAAMAGALLFTGLATSTAISISATPAFAASYTNYLNAGSQLNPGDSLWSPNHLYMLTQQADGNLVLYSEPGNKPFWASSTSGHGGSVTQFQSDGNLVVYAPGHIAIWGSGSSGHPNSVLFMQNDANVVIRAPGNIPVWATNAQNVAGCTDGSRSQAAQYATAGQFYDAVPQVNWTEQHFVSGPNGGAWDTFTYKVELRYDPATRCAWAVFNGTGAAKVYIDRSSDGGQTWTGWMGTQGSSVSTYTGVFNDSYPYVIRACASADNIYCTGWF